LKRKIEKFAKELLLLMEKKTKKSLHKELRKQKENEEITIHRKRKEIKTF